LVLSPFLFSWRSIVPGRKIAAVFFGKPIIGILGGIGSGKSYIADLFAEFGCLAIHSDKLVDAAYNDPEVLGTLRQCWGDGVMGKEGQIDRQAIAARIFEHEPDRRLLEAILHSRVADQREKLMLSAASDPKIAAFVWDSPLLLETGLSDQCDALVFVDAPAELRLARVRAGRGWDEAEMARRENLQWPLDKKRKISEYVIDNTADAVYARGQVKDVLFRIQGKRR
jgi:dephospho-CoA kinase